MKIHLGIDTGSTTAKLCLVANGEIIGSGTMAHDGNVASAVESMLGQLIGDNSPDNVTALVTGTKGRHRIALKSVIAPMAVEKGIEVLGLHPRAVVSMGGEDLVVYPLDESGRITGTFSGNKCASGTGEFFRQQLGRMDLTLDDLDQAATGAKILALSARCSVFMKSDCTHRLNKGEATPGDIALSMCKVMADKITDFLIKARIREGKVVLIGGVTQNKFIIKFLKEAWTDITFIVPEQASFFEAFGAAHMAVEQGVVLPKKTELFREIHEDSYDRFGPVIESKHLVQYVSSRRGKYEPNAEYILGVDGGSTTTKATLINADTMEIVAQHYGRTHGKPVEALKECIREIKQQIGLDEKPKISLASTTGSSRELLGVFLETAGVYNEIIAHATGTNFFEPEIDTVFEIGGQDAKYIRLEGTVPVDYAMNEACSAGTGSFIEESAHGDLNIDDVTMIGPVALDAPAPLKFGEHCSAFINSDIRMAIAQGCSKADIAAGIIFSIVANYLNRVVGNRLVGEHIALQGGVAKNPAVPLAFARITGRKITVPPDPELMGCFGVALLAKRKSEENLLEKDRFELDEILKKEIVAKGEFTCRACDNHCAIRNLEVSGRRYPFGGRCSKFTSARKKKKIHAGAVDYTEVRAKMLHVDFAPSEEKLICKTSKVVGVPAAFSYHSLWPFYSWFFHELGVRTVVSDEISSEGIAKLESSYCFPAEIAHGAIQNIIDKDLDFVFLPHFRDMPSMEKKVVHGTLCPLTQGLPFFARKAFELPEEIILRPVVTFEHGWDQSKSYFQKVAKQLGFTDEEGAAAYDKGITEYHNFLKAYKKLGDEVLENVKNDPSKTYVTLLGRPYNAFTRDANMGIPRKFTSQGITVIPFDMIYRDDDEIYPNMYWYYGQQNMKAAKRVMEYDNLYLTWISNFSCAPDSFMLHYIRWMMGRKPYLILEIDSHSADAGIDTRVEAFLDVVESFRQAKLTPDQKPLNRRYKIELKEEFADVVDTKTGEHIDIRDPRVTLVWPSMGDLSVEATSVSAAKTGLNSIFLPVSDNETVQLARNVASGKECIPSLLVLGSILKFMQTHEPNRPDEFFLFFVPSTTGPCRTGQYHVFYERLFEEMGWRNVIIMVAEADNSYRELGKEFNRYVWWALVLGDYFTDARLGIKLLAKDVEKGMEVFNRCWKNTVAAINGGPKMIEQALSMAGLELAAIPRRRSIDDIPKVLIVGEIFVRRDTFSIREINEYLVSQGVFPKVTDITEWVRYTDFVRMTALENKQQREGLFKTGVFREKTVFHMERLWKDMVEHKVARHIVPTGLTVHAPHDMQKIMENTKKHFVDRELRTEAAVSSGVAATAMEEDFSGVVIIAPFACLPGRLLEGIYAPWARERNYPVLALENDGQPYPPSTLARMEVFAHNAKRFNRESSDKNHQG